MTELMNKSLAQIVTSNHRAAAVFEKYHLDFCCRGKRSLEQACTEDNLKVEEVVAELSQVSAGNSCAVSVYFEHFTPIQLVDYIVSTHHSYVKKESPSIYAYLYKVTSKHADRHPELSRILELFTRIKEEMEQHMEKEELVLFPRIKEIERTIAEGKEVMIPGSYLISPIMHMESDHEEAGSLLAEIRQLTNNYTPPADACTTYKLCFASLHAFELDLHQHVHLENNILFPKALKMYQALQQFSKN